MLCSNIWDLRHIIESCLQMVNSKKAIHEMEDWKPVHMPPPPKSQVFHLGRETDNLSFCFCIFQYSWEKMNAATTTGSWKCPIMYPHNLITVKILKDNQHHLFSWLQATVTSKLRTDCCSLPENGLKIPTLQ